MSLVNLLNAASGLPTWVTTSFPIIRKILIAIIGISALLLIIVVLCQSSSTSGGTNVLLGEIESYYAQNKGQSRQGKLRKWTVILSSVIFGLTILYFILTLIYKG